MIEIVLHTLVLMAIFFVLTPGVFVKLPAKGGVYLVAMVHAFVFGIVYFIFSNMFGSIMEGETNIYRNIVIPKGSLKVAADPPLSTAVKNLCKTTIMNEKECNDKNSTGPSLGCNYERTKRCTKKDATTSYEWKRYNLTPSESAICKDRNVEPAARCENENGVGHCLAVPGGGAADVICEKKVTPTTYILSA